MGTIKAYYHCKNIKNFGDLITPYIVKRITGRNCVHVGPLDGMDHIFLSGSILKEANNNTTVIGSGFGHRNQKVTTKPTIKIVRGPITGEMLRKQKFKKTWTYGDPGLILPNLFDPATRKKFELGIVPHYIDRDLFDWVKKDDMLVIDICQPVETVIRQAKKCRYLISSSLHGWMLGHAYNIPTMLVKFSDRIVGDGMKYEDYALSVGLTPYKPVEIENGIVPDDITDMIPNEQITIPYNLGGHIRQALHEIK